jgi:single-strand DNA-binding protein
MSGLNKMLVIGNLGSDPEMRYTPNGNPVTSFTVATNRNYTTSSGERREETEWFRVVAWNQLAEHCNQFLAKGRRVYVEGRLKSDTWTGQDGQTRFRNEIIANSVLFLDRSGGGGPGSEEGAPTPGQAEEPVGDAEDLPW